MFLPLDKSKIPNLANLDPAVMKRIATQDPGNQYGVPYMIGTTGIGYNVDMLKQRFGGSTDIANSWDLVFAGEHQQDEGLRRDHPGHAYRHDPDRAALPGPGSAQRRPYRTAEGTDLLKSIRPYVQNFHSSQYVGSLANGGTCLVVGWSGDIIQARDRAEEASNGVHVAYSIPKEGAPQWFDMLAIPKDAKHPEAAYRFINYLLEPKVAAANTNFIHYANPIPTATPLVDEAIRNDPTIYPPADVAEKMFTYSINTPETDKLYTRLWTEVKTYR